MNIDLVIQQALETLLWSSWGEDYAPLDANYTIDDIDRDDEYGEFVEQLTGFIETADAEGLLEGLTESDIGHNFILSANGHGTGFWDRGLGDRGQALHELAKPSGDIDLYVGDNGSLYIQI